MRLMRALGLKTKSHTGAASAPSDKERRSEGRQVPAPSRPMVATDEVFRGAVVEDGVGEALVQSGETVTRVLPPEILSLIFNRLPYEEMLRGPFAVCRRWNNVARALGAPQLVSAWSQEVAANLLTAALQSELNTFGAVMGSLKPSSEVPPERTAKQMALHQIKKAADGVAKAYPEAFSGKQLGLHLIAYLTRPDAAETAGGIPSVVESCNEELAVQAAEALQNAVAALPCAGSLLGGRRLEVTGTYGGRNMYRPAGTRWSFRLSAAST